MKLTGIFKRFYSGIEHRQIKKTLNIGIGAALGIEFLMTYVSFLGLCYKKNEQQNKLNSCFLKYLCLNMQWLRIVQTMN